MKLEELRAQARTVASRMEARITTAIEANRELTAEETTANEADEAELAGLKSQITTAETGDGKGTPADAADPTKVAVEAERTRILALADLCPSSVLATPLRKAIADGVDAGAFAIGLATAAKQRGASMDDLRAGVVPTDKLPANAGKDAAGKTKTLTGAERGASIVARAAAAGHSALAHLKPKG